MKGLILTFTKSLLRNLRDSMCNSWIMLELGAKSSFFKAPSNSSLTLHATQCFPYFSVVLFFSTQHRVLRWSFQNFHGSIISLIKAYEIFFTAYSLRLKVFLYILEYSSISHSIPLWIRVFLYVVGLCEFTVFLSWMSYDDRRAYLWKFDHFRIIPLMSNSMLPQHDLWLCTP